ncbi:MULTISPECIES: flagellar hook assembly protein FlgD [unclassified Methylobacterium]|jgi:flagellar basal-body rod modification protein FlgD|uniref:flagellar hook assembly protein FlgD n=1 Tax=unclassified Methylobacterium TaxID=2615210 RepID=UPI0013550346|nr:flagellar hook assembly protein FlgD [Methylobacterium sp. 2A]MWV25095.1 flagellar hook assembly protein FlgD [Methylobacterium sp. 2A]
MSVPLANNTGPSTGAADAAAKAAADKKASAAKQTTLNYDNFLNLLLAQMKNQNPTDPIKSTEYMSQLATFSQVEQSVNMNSKLDALLASSTMSEAGNLVGRTVTSADQKSTGTVTSVQMTKDGLVAHLDSGKDVPYAPGMTVS